MPASQLLTILKHEHDEILDVLAALHDWASTPAPRGLGTAGARDELADFVRFLVCYADGWHHAKEEGLLFEAMVREGFARHMGPVAVMWGEHAVLREHLDALADVAARRGPLTPAERNEVARRVAAYVGLLVRHIEKENHVLFPMAERRLPAAALAELDAAARAFAAGHGPDTGAELEDLGASLVARHAAPPAPASDAATTGIRATATPG